jgi:hypothetical protein
VTTSSAATTAGAARIAAVLAIAGTALLLFPSLVGGRPLPGAPRCPVFPRNSPWNQRVDRLPVAHDSARLIASIGLSARVHPDFGSGRYDGEPIGIPFAVVSRHTRRVPVSFEYATESDGLLYPLPRNVPIEGGPSSTGDRHVIVIDRDSCRDYELYDAYPQRGGAAWHAGSGAIFNLRSDRLRPPGWTSADAAGLPILPGLARYDEVVRGVIAHALRFTAPRTRAAYVYPARHFASSSNDPSLPPMGLRVRLRASIDVSHLPRQARIVAEALRRYGLILADNGSPWYISGAPDPHWDNDALHTLDKLTGSDFEVVDTRSLPHPGL